MHVGGLGDGEGGGAEGVGEGGGGLGVGEGGGGEGSGGEGGGGEGGGGGGGACHAEAVPGGYAYEPPRGELPNLGLARWSPRPELIRLLGGLSRPPFQPRDAANVAVLRR